jgi:hypothetical protein
MYFQYCIGNNPSEHLPFVYHPLFAFHNFVMSGIFELQFKPNLSVNFMYIPSSHPPRFGSFGQAVSEKMIFRNQPNRNNNCLWQPCLLTDRDEISNLYRGPSIDASYQVSVQLTKHF